MSVFLMVAAMAAAGDGNVVKCAVAKMPKLELAKLQQGMIVGVLEGKKPAPPIEALVKKARAHAATCQPGTGKADTRAGELVVTSIAVEALASGLGANGVDPVAINRRLSQTPPAVLNAFLARKQTAEVDAFMNGMLELAGAKKAQVRVQRLMGGYAFNAATLARLFASRAA
ncbi:hypothetical protein ASG37_11455 [Sphingomonas sp. Leaf407]|uniref:hypothetical protein n=1 Tax=unclassified Sphingomonas TaxID=196159 RepID=UPI0006FDEFE1|nr:MULTISPECIES: hypothetical protein [unclassified Sphingomonas]KQN37637.1 hypothetical protein ASE97_08745 [Sphingomonas sp. Leaf42]KQT28004.1 hypothetical protein ASG37_11455 [Sphingomonas sp. Leaf407]